MLKQKINGSKIAYGGFRIMILADKIMNLRKQQGMSQEELAHQLGISRQSVSKWESGASIPDLDKILKLSDLFGVSTDYLLKDELEEISYSESSASLDESIGSEIVKSVSIEEANAFMDLYEVASRKIGLGVVLCILSPVLLILAGGFSEYGGMKETEDFLCGIGVAVLLSIIAVAVTFFIKYGLQLEKYEYMEKEKLSLQYGVQGIVEKKKEAYEEKFRDTITRSTLLCILGVIPLVVGGAINIGDFILVILVDLLLILIAIATYGFVVAGMIHSSYQMLLQQGDYDVRNKTANKKINAWAGAYWCLVTAIFLGVSFLTNAWDMTWLIWVVAGVLYGGIYCLIAGLSKGK